jgi:hypothetical protein
VTYGKGRVSDTKGNREPNQSQGTAEAEMVLSDVSETMQRRQWIQVPSDLRVASSSNDSFCGKTWKILGSAYDGISEWIYGYSETTQGEAS